MHESFTETVHTGKSEATEESSYLGGFGEKRYKTTGSPNFDFEAERILSILSGSQCEDKAKSFS